MMQKNTKKAMAAPVITVIVLELIMGLIIFAMLCAMKVGMGFLTVFALVYIAAASGVAVCSLIALKKRKDELDSGEAEEAKKY